MKNWEIIANNLNKAGWSWAVSQQSIPTGKQSLLQMRTATTEGALLCGQKADCVCGIGEGGLYPPIERTILTIIAAMAASITLCVPDEKLTAFLELESEKEGASGWLQQRGQMTRARSRSSRKLCACVTSRNSSGVR